MIISLPDKKVSRPHVLFTSLSDPADITAWSGTIHNLSKMLLDQGFSVEYLKDLLLQRRLLLKVMERSRAMFLGRKPVPVDRRISTAEQFARRIERHLQHSTAEMVYSPSSIPIAFLKTDRPKIFQTDATFAGIIHQYPELSLFPTEFMDEAHQLERLSLKNCDMAIYSSQWAANSAVKEYGADPAKVLVVPFGSNLCVDHDKDHVMKAIKQRPRHTCKLLYIGVHWQRKGGAIALEAARMLHAMGVNVQLEIIGCIPPEKELPPYVHVHPFINKRKLSERQRLAGIIEQCNFLILPSRADCTPIVVNECNSLGVPCLTSDVGGLPEMIREGVNGHLLSVEAQAQAYADLIQRYYEDRQGYEALAEGAFQEHREWLGWAASGARVRKELMGLMRQQAA